MRELYKQQEALYKLHCWSQDGFLRVLDSSLKEDPVRQALLGRLFPLNPLAMLMDPASQVEEAPSRLDRNSLTIPLIYIYICIYR